MSPARTAPGGDKTTLTNLRRLAALRAIALLAYLAVALWLAEPPGGAVLALLAVGGATAMFSGWRARGAAGVGRREFFVHLLMDWLWLPPLLALDGGAANPFVIYLLVPLTIAAATQPRAQAWLLAAISIALYTGLIVLMPGEGGTAHAGHGGHHGGHHGGGEADFYRHLIGMWATFTFSALLIAGFVNSMASALRKRDRRLHRLRQDQAHRAQVLALGTLAAGTAHELASPLQTIGLLVEELQAQPEEHSDEAREYLELLQEQVDLCREALEQLRQRARDPGGAEAAQPVAGFIDRCIERWQLLRPEARFTLHMEGPAEVAARLPLTLEQSVISLLNNAADASIAAATDQPVAVTARWSPAQLQLQISDHGIGLDADSEEDGGGFGIGLMLSRTALVQLGGELALAPRSDGPGTVATVTLPLAAGEALA